MTRRQVIGAVTVAAMAVAVISAAVAIWVTFGWRIGLPLLAAMVAIFGRDAYMTDVALRERRKWRQ